MGTLLLTMRARASLCLAMLLSAPLSNVRAEVVVREDDKSITIDTPHLEAVIVKEGYVSGIAAGTLLDKKSGARDLGFGLNIVDWIMEPGSDEAYRKDLPGDLPYEFNNLPHGAIAKRSIEGPQICTQAKRIDTHIIRGQSFAAVKLSHQYTIAAPGHKTGSLWTQWLVFPDDTRYFLSSNRIDSVNASPAMFLRLDMPGHVRHKNGDTFEEVYLSYPVKGLLDKQSTSEQKKGEKEEKAFAGIRIPSSEFASNFAPDEKFLYQRDNAKIPERFFRGYRAKSQADLAPAPWLFGMTLDPGIVSEAWCHQRDYLCMIEEFGGRPIKAGESFHAAFVVGYFDTIEEANATYDRYRGVNDLIVGADGWKVAKPSGGK